MHLHSLTFTLTGDIMKKILASLIAFFALVSVAFAAVNVNTATKAELATLNGIGDVRAQAIIDYRTKNGPFKSMAELDKVPGIGEGTMAKIAKEVTLSGKTTVAAADVKKDAAPASTKAEMKKDAAPAMAADAKKVDKKEMTAAEKKAAAAEEKKAKTEAAKKEKADKKAAADAAKKEKADKAKMDKEAKAAKTDKPVKADAKADAAKTDTPKK